MWLWNFREPLFEALVRTASHHHPFLITPGSIITIVRHATAVLSVLAVRCCIQIPSSVTPDWLLGRRHAGNALDSRRQDRHYPRKVALITSVMAVILPPIWNLQSLISLIKLLFSLVMSLKVRRDRTQYPQANNLLTPPLPTWFPPNAHDPHQRGQLWFGGTFSCHWGWSESGRTQSHRRSRSCLASGRGSANHWDPSSVSCASVTALWVSEIKCLFRGVHFTIDASTFNIAFYWAWDF